MLCSHNQTASKINIIEMKAMPSFTDLPSIVLTGFSGTGKSTVGQLVAKQLGWDFADTDQMIIRESGMSIPKIFETKGEAWFRQLESTALENALSRSPIVVAVGGGTLTSPRNLDIAQTSSIVICLEANPLEIYNRLFHESSTTDERPLLNTPDPLAAIKKLKSDRQASYADSHWIIQTQTFESTEKIALEVLRGWHLCRVNFSHKLFRSTAKPTPFSGSRIGVSSERTFSPIFVDWGHLNNLTEHLAPYITNEKVFIISDDQVAQYYLTDLERTLLQSNIETQSILVPSGEATKTLSSASRIHGWMARNRAQRRDIVIALGGGVVGDLAGFIAATFGRGMRFIQIPTSLAAMVDASIGGKVAVNLRAAKNLVGSFHQPMFTFVDVKMLSTLPQRELRSGWAEAIKHGLVLDENYFAFLDDNWNSLNTLDPETTTKAIHWSAALKSTIVSMDETEQNGTRTLLNYGHTLGHAIEASAGYGEYLHGEAVSIGMHAVATIANNLGLSEDKQLLQIHSEILSRFGLPLRLTKRPSRGIKAAMLKDKKSVGNSINWVVLQRLGHPIVTTAVPHDLAISTLRNL